MSVPAKMQIIEYHNGKAMHLYDGLHEVSAVYHCHSNLIEGLIYTGNPFPHSDGVQITFDIAPWCHMKIERMEDDHARTRYYAYRIVKDSDNQPKADRRLT